MVAQVLEAKSGATLGTKLAQPSELRLSRLECGIRHPLLDGILSQPRVDPRILLRSAAAEYDPTTQLRNIPGTDPTCASSYMTQTWTQSIVGPNRGVTSQDDTDGQPDKD